MGKRIEVTPWKPGATIRKIAGSKRKVVFEDSKNLVTLPASAEDILAHKRAIKAAQMRRYRAKKAGK